MEDVLSDSLQQVALQDKLDEIIPMTISTSPVIRSKTLNPMDFLNSSSSEINLTRSCATTIVNDAMVTRTMANNVVTMPNTRLAMMSRFLLCFAVTMLRVPPMKKIKPHQIPVPALSKQTGQPEDSRLTSKQLPLKKATAAQKK